MSVIVLHQVLELMATRTWGAFNVTQHSCTFTEVDSVWVRRTDISVARSEMCFAGDVTTYRRWGLKMSKLLGGIQFFFVDYGLSPENKFPTALQQCWKTYLWLISKQVSLLGMRCGARISDSELNQGSKHSTREADNWWGQCRRESYFKPFVSDSPGSAGEA